jgi:hypothetical protein
MMAVGAGKPRISETRTRTNMSASRDLEQERQELLKRIEAALTPEVREALHAACQQQQEPTVVLPKNEVGSEHADQR